MEISKWWLQKPKRGKFVVRVQLSDGSVIQRSTKERLKKKAILQVSEILKEVRAELDPPASNWSRFIKDYEADHSGWSAKQMEKWRQVRFYFEEKFRPTELTDVTQKTVNDFCRQITQESKSKLTARNKISVLRAAINYAHRQGLVSSVPKFTTPKIVENEETVGRPLTEAEVETLLGVLASEVGNEGEKAWRFYINGLINSGFRLNESLRITWNDRRFISIDDLDSDIPMFLFPHGADKNKKKKRVPIIPAMRKQLLEVPLMERTGFLFNPVGTTGKRLAYRTVMKYFEAIGEASGIITDYRNGKPKYVSAHDLRRTFAERVVDDPNISPKDAQILMRHASFTTTMKHYARRAPEEVGKRIYSSDDHLAELLKEVQSVRDPKRRAEILAGLRELLEQKDDAEKPG